MSQYLKQFFIPRIKDILPLCRELFDYGPTGRVKTSCCRGSFIARPESIQGRMQRRFELQRELIHNKRYAHRTVPLKCKLPPLVSFLARRVSFLSRRVSFLSRRVSFLSRRDSFLARVTEPNILEYITREKPL